MERRLYVTLLRPLHTWTLGSRTFLLHVEFAKPIVLLLLCLPWSAQKHMNDLKDQAASSGSPCKYATRNVTTPNYKTIYELVQCIPDLSKEECSSCIDCAMERIPQCNCDYTEGGRVFTPSCNLRFEVYQFYGPNDRDKPAAPGPALPPTSSPPSPRPTVINAPTTNGICNMW